jgi:hypothetical protein
MFVNDRYLKESSMPKRDNETMEAFVMRLIRDETLKEAVTRAAGNAPDSEPGEYWKGRRDAAAIIDAMISER